MSEQLEAYVDSAVADTASIAERKDEIRAEAAAMAAASLDTTITTPLADSLGTQGDSLATAAAIMVRVKVQSCTRFHILRV